MCGSRIDKSNEKIYKKTLLAACNMKYYFKQKIVLKKKKKIQNRSQ